MEVSEIYKWWDIFCKDKPLTEIRIIGSNTNYSGYFKDVETLIREVQKYESYGNVYFTINSLDESCYGREQKDFILGKPKNTTSDKEITSRDWVYIDFDAKRITGVNATDEEIAHVKRTANKVYKYLSDNGFNKPVVVFSGNGVHFYYRTGMLNNDENTAIVKRFLYSLNMLFGDEHTEIDCSVFNLARISRLPGTFSAKGSKTDSKRPRRMCRFVQIPEVKDTDRAYFKKIADLYPEETNTYQNLGYNGNSFDLDDFLNKHGVSFKKESVTDGTKYILEHCFFDPNHKGKDAVLFKRNNGAIAYHCFHNSCSQYKWKDVRLLFEPDAYDRKSYNEFKFKFNKNKSFDKNENVAKFEVEKESERKGKKWLLMKDISYVDFSSLLSIPTGFTQLDKKLVGLYMGDITILSGLSGSGKSNWLGCLIMNAVQSGNKVAAWSGELQDFRFQSWIMQIAAGKNYVYKKDGYDDFYYAPKHVVEKIADWIDDKLLLYNNNYGNKFSQLFDDIKTCVEENDIRLIVLDNLMALDIDEFGSDKYSNQTKFINSIKEYAKEKNVHIVIVAHPRKEGGFLRMESISGTADIFNLADNVFIIHRVGLDFVKRAGEFFATDRVEALKSYHSVIEVCKNRTLGVKDFTVGMYFEKESRRLKNEIEESIIYGWQEVGVQQTFDIKPNYDFYKTDEQYYDENYLPF